MINKPSEENHEQPDIPKFKTNPLFQDMFPKYSEAELEALMKSIQTVGQLQPIYVNEKGEILDGNSRNEACERLGIRPTYKRVKFNTKEEEILFVLECNLNRRDLNAFQRIEVVALFREPIERERAAKRKVSGLKQGDKTPMAQIHTYGEDGRIRAILAPFARVGDNTYYKGSWLVKNAPEVMKEKLRKGIISIDRAHTSLYAPKKQKKKSAFTGEFVKINQSIYLLRGPFGELDEATIPKKSFDLIFPSADCSSDKKLATDIAIFAHRNLRKGGFLVVYVGHGYFGTILNAMTKYAKDLELLEALPVVFGSDWVNVEGSPVIETNTAMYFIFWKTSKELECQPLFSFEHPLSIDPEAADDNADHLIRPREANPYVLDHLIEALSLRQDMTVCDPTCEQGELGLRVTQYTLKFVGIENDFETFQLAKENIEKQLNEPQEDEESEPEPAQQPTDGNTDTECES